MVKLDSACPNKCGRQWFSVQKQQSIRRFKKTLLKSYKEYYGMGVPRRAGQVGFTYLVVIDY